MTDPDSASQQLRVIRSLMERATIYRAISVPMALIGGLLSLGGFAITWYADDVLHHPLAWDGFLLVWLVILALTGLTNLIFLSRDAARRGDPLFSSGMKCALTSLVPAFLFAGVMTLIDMHHPLYLALNWATLYGIGLLATQHFAPRSLVILGATFFVTGCVLFIACGCLNISIAHPQVEPSAIVASGVMAATFGGFHLVYAVAVWALGEDRVENDSPATGPANV